MGHNFPTGKATGYALGYVIKKDASKGNVGHGIGKQNSTKQTTIYVGRTDAEANAEKTVGAGDHVGVIATTKPTSVTKSNGAAPQGIVIEGSGTNVAADFHNNTSNSSGALLKKSSKFY